VQHRVTLHERAAAGILAGEAHRGALEQQGAEGEEFAEAPVDFAVATHVVALLHQLLQLIVHGEAGGLVQEGIADQVHDRFGHPGRGRFPDRVVVLVGTVLLGTDALRRGTGRADDRDRRGLRRVRLHERALEAVLEIRVRGLVFLLRDVAATDESLGEKLPDGALGLDQVVHQRLGHRGVVALVVPAAAVADEVDDDVPLEFLTVGEGELRDPHHGLGVVPVDVEDGRLDGLGDIRRVHRGASVTGQCGEADLVVDDQMDGAAGAEPAQLGHLERLQDDALAGHGRVAVHEDGEGGEGADRLAVLLGAHDALEDAVDGLEVGRVRGQVDRHLRAVGGTEGALGAEVVLDVAGALHGAGILRG